MKVWIVEGHIAYEGDEIVSVHSTKQKAEEDRERCEEIIKLPYDKRPEFQYSYCDNFTVSEWEVQEEL